MADLGHWVIATAAPRMASQDAAYRQIETLEGTVLYDGLVGVL